MAHTEGPGLKVLSKEKWYGSHGGCDICGTASDSLIPNMVRFWDCDDGWRTGVLCAYCGEDAASAGPSPDDYAYKMAQAKGHAVSGSDIDMLAAVLGHDLDGFSSMMEDW